MSQVEAETMAGGGGGKWLILSAVMLGSFMGPLDGSIVNTVLPDITRYFGADIAIVQWVPTVYLLTISCLILLYGRLGDMLGCKRIYLWGLGAFSVASALCGVSQSIWMLIGFRALQGLAAGMTTSVPFALITSAFPAEERGKAMGVYALSIAAALAIGPTLGGVIAEYLNWRCIFLVNIPIGLAALVWAARVIPRDRRNAGQRLDVAGAVAAFCSLTLLLLYANRGETWGWTSARSVVLLAGGVVGAVVFLRVERTAPQPMLDLALFGNRRFSLASISALLNFVALFAVIFLRPLHLAFALHFSILKIGLVMAASPVAMLVAAPLSGTLSDRIGIRGLTCGGMVTSAVGLYLLAHLSTHNPTGSGWDVAWRLAIVGTGTGLFQSPNNSAIMGSVPPWRLGVASGVIAAMRNVGMVIGIAVAGAVLYSIAPVAAARNPAEFTPEQIGAFVEGLHWAYVTGAGIAAAAAVTSLLAVGRDRGGRSR